MKTQNYVTLFLFVILPFIGLAQTSQLTTQQSEEEKTALLKKAPQTVIENEFQSANDYFIPLTITILHKDDGSGGGVSDNDVLELFCEVIDNYNSYDINLYIDTIRHINNSAWYNSDALEPISLLLDVENTVNVYFLVGIRLSLSVLHISLHWMQ